MNTLKQVIHYPDTNSVEATWIDSEDVVIKCHSYADVQMDMLRADLGDDAADYADLIALVESGIKPPASPTAEDILSKAKAARQATVDSIVVTTQSGKQFDGNELSQDRMNKAISVAVITGLASCTWVLADNVPTVVTVDELKEALALSFQAMGAVWAKPYEATPAPEPTPEPAPE